METSSSPAMQLSSVDFPHPDSPRSTRNSPCGMSMSSDFRTSTAPKLSDTFLTATLVMRSALHSAGRDAAHEKFSGDEVNDQRHQAGDDGGRHVDVVFLYALHGIHDVVELHCHRIGVGLGVNDTEEEV